MKIATFALIFASLLALVFTRRRRGDLNKKCEKMADCGSGYECTYDNGESRCKKEDGEACGTASECVSKNCEAGTCKTRKRRRF